MKKKLTKSNNVVLTGTLGGIAEFLGIDPTIVRVIYVFLSFVSFGFITVPLYIILAVLIPSSRNQGSTHGQQHYQSYYKPNNYNQPKKPRKEAEKVDDDDWSDF